jgi:hypothetical protein
VLTWNGKRKGARRPLPASLHRLVAAAVDEAGNIGTAPPIYVAIRYIELGRTMIRATARTRFGVRVTTDASSYRWRFAGRTGVGKPGLLVLRAPRAGRYLLFVEANGHGARARVVVQARQPASSRSPAASNAASAAPASGQTR